MKLALLLALAPAAVDAACNLNCQNNNIATCNLGECTSTTAINLIGKGLYGTLPPSVVSLSALKSFYIGDNQLYGSIPAGLGSLNALTSFGAWYNQLSGVLPSSFGSLSSLEYVFINGITYADESGLPMNLHGTIPPSVGSLSNLKWLSLYQNKLSGNIPPSLGSLKQLTQFFLDNNKLTGQLPNSLGSLDNVEWLALWRNQLTGTLPHSVSSLYCKLDRFYVSINQITGSIPLNSCPFFEGLSFCSLRELGVDCPSECSDLLETKCHATCRTVYDTTGQTPEARDPYFCNGTTTPETSTVDLCPGPDVLVQGYGGFLGADNECGAGVGLEDHGELTLATGANPEDYASIEVSVTMKAISLEHEETCSFEVSFDGGSTWVSVLTLDKSLDSGIHSTTATFLSTGANYGSSLDLRLVLDAYDATDQCWLLDVEVLGHDVARRSRRELRTFD